MEDSRDLGGEALVVDLGEAEAGLADVAGDHLEALAVELRGCLGGRLRHPWLDQGHEPGLRVRLEQAGGQAAADESGEAGQQEGAHTGNLSAAL